MGLFAPIHAVARVRENTHATVAPCAKRSRRSVCIRFPITLPIWIWFDPGGLLPKLLGSIQPSTIPPLEPFFFFHRSFLETYMQVLARLRTAYTVRFPSLAATR